MELRVEQIKKDLKRFRENKQVFKRLRVLYESIQYKKLKTVLVNYQISERTFYRWKKRYLTSGALGLMDQSGRGRKCNWIRGKQAKRIVVYRKKYLWGAEVIHEHLKRDHGIRISEGRIYRFLKDQKLIKKQRRKQKSKHTKKVVIFRPGLHTQVDVKHVTHIKKKKRIYMYNFVDHASRWSYKRAYDSFGPKETADFLQRVLYHTPFTIETIQSDNGIEFTNKYISDPIHPKEHAMDRICAVNDISHRLIEPGVKEHNGLVEKHHHLDFKECYRHLRTLNLKQINAILENHCLWRNANRRYKSLGWISPNEYLRNWRKEVNNLPYVFDKKLKKVA